MAEPPTPKTPDCDHENLSTNFCPHCGAPSRDPLAGLLAHLRSHAKRPIESYESSVRKGHDADWTAKRKRVADKWRGWVRAVEKALEQQKEQHDGTERTD